MNQILPTTFSAAFKAFFVVQNTVPSALLTAIKFSIVNLFHLFSFLSIHFHPQDYIRLKTPQTGTRLIGSSRSSRRNI